MQVDPANDASVVTYRVDALDRIAWVDDGWCSFAEANGAPELADGALGQDLFESFAGVEIHSIIASLLDEVRSSGRTISLSYRCDSPSARRRFRLEVIPLETGQVEFRSTLVDVEQRESQRLDLGLPEHPDGLVMACAWCKRYSVSGEWVEIEVAMERLRPLEADPVPGLSHGVCPECQELVMQEIKGAA